MKIPKEKIQEIVKILINNYEDSENYPNLDIWAQATTKTIIELLEEQ